MSGVTYDDQRPKLSGSGNADAPVPNTLGGQPVTLNAGGYVTTVLGTTLTYVAPGGSSAAIGGWTASAQYTATNGHSIQDTYYHDSFLRPSVRIHADNAVTTNDFYVHDGANLVARIDSSNVLQDAYLFDGVDHPLRLSRGGTSYFYEVDLAGNVRRLRDSTGADLGGYRYTAFGQTFAADAQTPAPTIDQPLRWKGRWFDPAAGGVYDMRARWWSPQMGAFLSIDDFGYQDGNSTLWGWPSQNPVGLSDTSGHEAAVAAWWFLGGAANLPDVPLAAVLAVVFAPAVVVGATAEGPTIVGGPAPAPAVSSPSLAPPENPFDLAKQTGKEKASDAPDWAKRNPPLPGERAEDYAKRILEEKYGKDYPTGPGSEFNKIKKWAQRSKGCP